MLSIANILLVAADRPLPGGARTPHHQRSILQLVELGAGGQMRLAQEADLGVHGLRIVQHMRELRRETTDFTFSDCRLPGNRDGPDCP